MFSFDFKYPYFVIHHLGFVFSFHLQKIKGGGCHKSVSDISQDTEEWHNITHTAGNLNTFTHTFIYIHTHTYIGAFNAI